MSFTAQIAEHSRVLRQARIMKTVAGIGIPYYRRLAAEQHYTVDEVVEIVADMRTFGPYREALSHAVAAIETFIPSASIAEATMMRYFLHETDGLGPQTLFNGILANMEEFLLGSPMQPVLSASLTYERLEYALENVWRPRIPPLVHLLRSAAQRAFWSRQTSIASLVRVFKGFRSAAPLLHGMLEHVHQVPFDRSLELLLPSALDLITGAADPVLLDGTLRQLRQREATHLAALQSLAKERTRRQMGNAVEPAHSDPHAVPLVNAVEPVAVLTSPRRRHSPYQQWALDL